MSKESLDTMVYNVVQSVDGVTEDVQVNIQCNYILPNQITHNSKGISIMNYNIRSMQSNFANFTAELLDGGRSCDVIGLCETRLTDATANLYTLNNYSLFSNNVSSSKGGVCLYLHNRFNCKVRDDLIFKKDHIETIFVEVINDKKPFIIGMIYRRPGTAIERFIVDLTRILDKIKCKCILLGDFNLNLLNELNNTQVQNFVNTFRQYFFKPVITKPTRVCNNSASLIDHIWINFDQVQYVSNIIITGVSDHFPVLFNVLTHNDRSTKTISYRRSGNHYDNAFKERLQNASGYIFQTNHKF